LDILDYVREKLAIAVSLVVSATRPGQTVLCLY
jgi:hypothetical protein